MAAEGSGYRAEAASGVRLAELVGTLSFAVDLGLGQPMDHVARSCLLATRLGERVGLEERERAAVYYIALLGWVGCIADSPEVSRSFGDDIAYRAGVFDVDMAPLPFLGYLIRNAGPDASAARRFGIRATAIASGASSVKASLRQHCLVTATIAERLGLDETVSRPLAQIFARADGKGLPAGLGGDQIALSIRLWQLCDVAEVHHRKAGTSAAIRVINERSGTQFDPEIVDAFTANAEELFAGLPDGSAWDALIAAEPGLHHEMSNGDLDSALEVLADYADLKVPGLRGHSRAVANLASDTAARLGLAEAETRLLRRAALVHDLGRAGVPNSILDKGAKLTESELERLRMHSYFTERMFQRPKTLREIGEIAAMAHERLDGSGYHRGLKAPAIPLAARILAAANEFRALLEPRSGPLSARAAANRLIAEVSSGHLDSAVVDAVLACAGQQSDRRPTGPAGLTGREVEVLVLVARGASNKQIAHRLGIAVKTVGSHVERIYLKIGVSSRATATLFAMQHGLLDQLDPIG